MEFQNVVRTFSIERLFEYVKWFYKIPSNVFNKRLKLNEIEIPLSVTKIDHQAFNLNQLVNLTNKMTAVPDNLFKICNTLAGINIASSVTVIGESSFEGCTSLKEIIIPSSVTTICKNSFKACTNLNKITINSQTKIQLNSN